MDIGEVLAKAPDSIFQHLGRTWSAREIVQLKCVCKTWTQLVSENSMNVAISRSEDDTKDWYFPLRFELDTSKEIEGEYWNSYTWSGVHHASGEIHRLPPLPPFNWDSILRAPRMSLGVQYCDLRLGSLIASVGGLLLFANKMITWNSRKSSSLVVLNPLTQQWRSLPAARELPVILTGNRSIEAHMTVDERANSYKVIITFLHHICIYTSTSDSWQYRSCSEVIPFGTQPPSEHQELMNRTVYRIGPCISVLAAGKIYRFQLVGQDVEEDYSLQLFRTRGYIKMVEIDYEAGTKKPPVRHALGTYFLHDEPDEWYGFGPYSRDVKIVGCMDGLYAILPAMLDLETAMDGDIMRAHGVPDRGLGDTYEDFGCVPMQFYVLRLSGTGLLCGRLLIRIPVTLSWEDRRMRQECGVFQLWYWCIGRGRVIRLLWGDYLVDYDVVTGISTTKILPDDSFGPQNDHQLALDYRASFHMKA